MSKIQADEISSIIKERIDNFELNIDIERGITICCYIPTDIPYHLFQQGIIESASAPLYYKPPPDVFEVINKTCFETFEIPILKNKEHEKYGWYRKFEKKRF